MVRHHRHHKSRVNIVLLFILVGMLSLLMFDTTPAVADYMEWQWEKSDKLAGYLKKLSLAESEHTIFGILVPAFGYMEQRYVPLEEMNDPSYEYYLDVQTEDESVLQPEEQSQPAQETEPVETSAEVLPVSADNRLLSRQQLLVYDELIKNHYNITSITDLRQEDFDVEKALDMDMTLQQGNEQPQILIFHTHSQEGFADTVEGDTSTTIVGVGEYLAQILREKYGYNVIHDTSVYDLIDGKLDRSKAYTYAEKGIEQILAENPSIEVIIDLHRDGVDESNHLVTEINGKPTARIMFFNGMSYTKVNGRLDYLPNPYIEENLAMSLQMKLLGDLYYPGLLRKNYIHGYRYCLHYRGKSMLIEAGAQNNTLEEEKNAMEPLAEMLHRLFTGERAYN